MSHDAVPLSSGVTMSIEELKTMAAEVAQELQASASDAPAAALRERFIRVRTALFQRGIYDPVLVRFDTASAPKATQQQVGEQLATVAAAL